MKNKNTLLALISLISTQSIAQSDVDLKYFDKILVQYQAEVNNIEKLEADKKNKIEEKIFEKYQMKKVGKDIYSFYSENDPGVFPANVSLIKFKNELVLVNAGKNYEVARNLYKTIESNFGKAPYGVFIESSAPEYSQAASFWFDKGVNIYMHKTSISNYHKNFKQGPSKKLKDISKEIRWFRHFYDKKIDGELVKFRYYGKTLRPGSMIVELREREFIFAGETVITNEIPMFNDKTSTIDWVNAYRNMVRYKYTNYKVMPGVGNVSDLEKTEKTTFELLREMQVKSIKLRKGGKKASDAYNALDHERFSNIGNYYKNMKFNLTFVFKEFW